MMCQKWSLIENYGVNYNPCNQPIVQGISKITKNMEKAVKALPM